MAMRQWMETNLRYGGKLAASGMKGANAGKDRILQSEPLRRYLGGSLEGALKPTVVAAGVGVLSACFGRNRRSTRRKLTFGILGGAVGFTAVFAWRTRKLAAGMTCGALLEMRSAHEARWLEKHPINYA